MMDKKNRHPADRLADARKAKVAAEKEEHAARAEAQAAMDEWNTEVLEGEDAVVTRDHQQWRGPLDKELIKQAGLDPDQFRRPTRPVDYLKMNSPEFRGRPRVISSAAVRSRRVTASRF